MNNYYFQHLPDGQQRALDSLINGADGTAVTYREAAESLGIAVGTLKTHLKRIRKNDPDTYYFMMNTFRKPQLAVRHKEALERADAHSHQYHINMIKSDNFLMRMALGTYKRKRKLSKRDQAIKDLRDRGLGSDYLYDPQYSDYKP